MCLCMACLPANLQAVPRSKINWKCSLSQVALTTILGFKEGDISAPMLARCSRLFRDWLNGLFSLAIDLPGLSAPSLLGQAIKLTSMGANRCRLTVWPGADAGVCGQMQSSTRR